MKMIPTLIPTVCGTVVVVDMALACVGRIIQIHQQKIEGGEIRSFSWMRKKAGSLNKSDVCEKGRSR